MSYLPSRAAGGSLVTHASTHVAGGSDEVAIGLLTGTAANAQILAAAVTQHQAALSIGAAQLTGTISSDRLSGVYNIDARGSLLDKDGAVRNVKHPDYGAVGDNSNDDTAEIQAAIDDIGSDGGTVVLPSGRYKVTATLSLKRSRTIIRGEGATIFFTGASDTLFDAVPTSGTQIEQCSIEGLTLDITGDAAKAIDFSAFKHSDFTKLFFSLRTANQIAIYGQGNAGGTGPYYSVFDSITIEGIGGSTQTGVQLVSGSSGVDADGANGNMFSNFRRIAAVGIAFDIQSGHGNLLNNLHAESIVTAFARFNQRSADTSGTATGGSRFTLVDTGASFTSALVNAGLIITSGAGSGERAVVKTVDSGTTLTLDRSIIATIGATTVYELYESKAVGNKFSQVRIEGANTSSIADFKAGSIENTVAHVVSTGISTTTWKKDVGDLSNIVSFTAGMVFPISFATGTLPSAQAVTHRLVPGAEILRADTGGIPFFRRGAIVGVEMWVFDRTAGELKPIVTNDASAISMVPVLDGNSPSSARGEHCEGFLEDLVEGSAQDLNDQGPMLVAIQSDGSFTKGSDYRAVVTVWIMQ